MPKLTLNVDSQVVRGAKQYAQRRGTSVSRLVETMLRLVAASGRGAGRDRSAPAPAVLARLRGSLARGDRRAYRRYLERKHR